MNIAVNLPYRLGGQPPERITRALYQRWASLGARLVLQPNKKSKTDPAIKNASLEELAVWSAEWGRYDARLFEVLLDWLWTHWSLLHPGHLNHLVLRMPHPAAWGILYEWTHLRKAEITPAQEGFWQIVLQNIKPDSSIPFFVEGKLRSFLNIKREILPSREVFKRWGFLGKDSPSISEWKRLKVDLTPSERRDILKSLASEGSVSLQKYLSALPTTISRQTATRDFQNAPFLKRVGKTKGATYKQKITDGAD